MDLIEKTTTAEHRHPWEIVRSRILDKLIKSYPAEQGHWVDVGAGDQYVYSQFSELGFFYLIDKEFDGLKSSNRFMMLHDLAGVDFAKVRGIFLLDVLEHIEDDEGFFAELYSLAYPGTMFYITVPACQSLFSKHDEFLRHFRRYDAKGLKKILNQSNAKIGKIHYFFFSLFLIRAIQKIGGKSNSNQISAWKYSKLHVLTKIVTLMLYSDYKICEWLNQLGINLPGLSLVAVLKKA